LLDTGDDFFQPLGHCFNLLRKRRRVLFLDGDYLPVNILALKRRDAGDRLVKHYTRASDVGALVYARSYGLFG